MVLQLTVELSCARHSKSSYSNKYKDSNGFIPTKTVDSQQVTIVLLNSQREILRS